MRISTPVWPLPAATSACVNPIPCTASGSTQTSPVQPPVPTSLKAATGPPAEEVTRGDLKTGRAGNRTPFQILADHYQTGDLHDRRLWRQYSRVTRGLAAVRWSHGLRRRMLGPTAEPGRADAELASEDVNGDLIAVIPLPVWSHIRLAGLEHAVLVAAEHGGLADVNSLIRPTCLRADRPPKSAAAAADPIARSALTTLSARQ